MLELLEGGRRRLFWTAWEKYVPVSIRETDPNLTRLEVDLHVYFVVAALCPPKVREGLFPPIGAGGRRAGSAGRPADAMPEGVRGGDQVEAIEALKAHLDGRGRALVESGECSHYCTLAVLARPWESAQLKDMFQPAWSAGLRNKVVVVLAQVLRPPPMPKMAALVGGGAHGLGQGGGEASGSAVDGLLEGALSLARAALAQLDVSLAEQGKAAGEAEPLRARLGALMASAAERARALHGAGAWLSTFTTVCGTFTTVCGAGEQLSRHGGATQAGVPARASPISTKLVN